MATLHHIYVCIKFHIPPMWNSRWRKRRIWRGSACAAAAHVRLLTIWCVHCGGASHTNTQTHKHTHTRAHTHTHNHAHKLLPSYFWYTKIHSERHLIPFLPFFLSSCFWHESGRRKRPSLSIEPRAHTHHFSYACSEWERTIVCVHVRMRIICVGTSKSKVSITTDRYT
jgi:hypothetical protein